MRRQEALASVRPAVLERWFETVLATYPAETAAFIRREKDRFGNPVGHALRTGLERLYDGLGTEAPAGELAPALDGIVRIRAVQEFAPSAAVAFVPGIKAILRAELTGAALAPEEWAGIDAAVDRLALLAFDVYMQCRERLFEIRLREIREFQGIAARAGACAQVQGGGMGTHAGNRGADR